MGMTTKEAFLFIGDLMERAYDWHINNRVLGFDFGEFEGKCEELIRLIKTQEQKHTAHWIKREGRYNVWYCSNCGEKINYNEDKKTRQKRVFPVWIANKYCRMCGREMTVPPSDTQREATPWS